MACCQKADNDFENIYIVAWDSPWSHIALCYFKTEKEALAYAAEKNEKNNKEELPEIGEFAVRVVPFGRPPHTEDEENLNETEVVMRYKCDGT